MKFSFGGFVLIVFGALVLARNLGYLNISIAELIGTWWPLGLIVLRTASLRPTVTTANVAGA